MLNFGQNAIFSAALSLIMVLASNNIIEGNFFIFIIFILLFMFR